MEHELAEQIRREISAAGGAISLARFMERALYEPGLGYYERDASRVGRHGDFYTSVSVGPVFGDLMGFQFANGLDSLGPNGSLHLVEAGAHDGRLMADVLGWFRRHRPDLSARLESWLVEPSSTRQGWQATTLESFSGSVHWATDLTGLRNATGGVHGIIYSNELLDAFPVHRLVWLASRRTWWEMGVGDRDGKFVWQALPDPSPAIRGEIERFNQLPPELLDVLPEGFATEVSPAATAWWATAAGSLTAGRLVTLDYGLTDEEFLLPHRSGGTFRGYSRHHPVGDPLAYPGEQDLTAHINFSALQRTGEKAGLITEALTSQRQWLTGIFGETLKLPGSLPDWSPARVRQFQALTHPEHLGRAFRVLTQRRESRPV